MIKTIRRKSFSKRDKAILLCSFAFTLAASFAFLSMKNQENTQAASLANFDAGDIISDETMSNYNIMSETDIQNFLKSKNSCNDRRLNLVGNKTSHLDMSGTMNWHVENGHFVCMADERFDGESAAHIIWQAAQDYKINPQVLIVLLQKEQGLVTDTLPRSGQYRAATGYGCPDTAPCATEYYGFRNQVRKAAAMYRNVLNGGWTNYPVGNNYIQYSPNAACGGSIVNVKNRATSALYRYTPYQPNAAALAAGYGTCHCGAYGNRNFYLYFTDWFGDTHSGVFRVTYSEMGTQRIMVAKKTITSVATNKRGPIGVIEKDTPVKFSHRTIINGEICLKSVDDVKNDINRCYYLRDLDEYKGAKYVDVSNPRLFYIPAGTRKINTASNSIEDQTFSTIDVAMRVKFVGKTGWFGRLCLRTESDTAANRQACIPYDSLKEIHDIHFSDVATPRIFVAKANTYYVDPEIDMRLTKIPEGTRLVMLSKTYGSGHLCLRTEADTQSNKSQCVYYSDLTDTEDIAGKEYYQMGTPRYMKLTKDSTYNLTSGKYIAPALARKGEKLHFTQKTVVDGALCLRSDEDIASRIPRCISINDLSETAVPMGTKRSLATTENTKLLDVQTGEARSVRNSQTIPFVEKYYTSQGLCLRSTNDSAADNNICYLLDTLKELE